MAPIVLVTGALDANTAVCQMAMLGLLGLGSGMGAEQAWIDQQHSEFQAKSCIPLLLKKHSLNFTYDRALSKGSSILRLRCHTFQDPKEGGCPLRGL